MVAPSQTSSHSFFDNKHYSFLNALDNIATTSSNLTLGPSSASKAKSDKSIKRLSTTLHNLIAKQHGTKHLPEMPIPVYDNGYNETPIVKMKTQLNDLVRLSADKQTSPDRSIVGNEKFSMYDSNFVEDSSDEEISHQLRTCTQQDSRHFTRRALVEPDPQKSRPVSIYSISTACRTGTERRRDTSGLTGNSLRHRKKSITFDERRGSLSLHMRQRSFKVESSPRRRFRFMPSTKKKTTEKKTKLTPTTPIMQEEVEEVTTLMSLQEALMNSPKSLHPLHDAFHDRSFTEECTRLLTLKADPTRCSFIDTPCFPSISASRSARKEIRQSLQHEDRPSQTETIATVNTNILDSEWPQSKSYTRAQEKIDANQTEFDSHPRIEEIEDDDDQAPFNSPGMRGLLTSSASIPRIWHQLMPDKHSVKLSPTAPPDRPLPLLPSALANNNTARRLAEKATRSHAQYEQPPPLSMTTQTSAQLGAHRNSNRVQTLAASKGLQVDSTPAIEPKDESRLDEPFTELVGELRVPPLQARFSQSSRNTKVNELKRRHLSMLVADSHFMEGSCNEAMFARHDSEPTVSINSRLAAANTGMRRATKGLPPKKKPLPSPPIMGTHARRKSRVVIADSPVQASEPVPSRSKTVQTTSEVSANMPTTASGLKRSPVLVLIDSSPLQSFSFSAGAVSPTNPAPWTTRGNGKGKVSRGLPPARRAPISSYSSRPSISSPVPSSVQRYVTKALPAIPPTRVFSTKPSMNEQIAPASREPQVVPYSAESGLVTELGQGSRQRALTIKDEALSSERNPEAEVRRLNHELGRMNRVYSAMVYARQGVRPEPKRKSYAELLENDRRTSLIAQQREEADLYASGAAPRPATMDQSPSGYESDSTITPKSSFNSSSSGSSSGRSRGHGRNDSGGSMTDLDLADFPMPMRLSEGIKGKGKMSIRVPPKTSSLATTDAVPSSSNAVVEREPVATCVESSLNTTLARRDLAHASSRSRSSSTNAVAIRGPTAPGTSSAPTTTTVTNRGNGLICVRSMKTARKRYSLLSTYNQDHSNSRNSNPPAPATAPPPPPPSVFQNVRSRLSRRTQQLPTTGTTTQALDTVLVASREQDADDGIVIDHFLTGTEQMYKGIETFNTSTGPGNAGPHAPADMDRLGACIGVRKVTMSLTSMRSGVDLGRVEEQMSAGGRPSY